TAASGVPGGASISMTSITRASAASRASGFGRASGRSAASGRSPWLSTDTASMAASVEVFPPGRLAVEKLQADRTAAMRTARVKLRLRICPHFRAGLGRRSSWRLLAQGQLLALHMPLPQHLGPLASQTALSVFGLQLADLLCGVQVPVWHESHICVPD